MRLFLVLILFTTISAHSGHEHGRQKIKVGPEPSANDMTAVRIGPTIYDSNFTHYWCLT